MSPNTESLTSAADQAGVDHTVWDRLGIAGSVLCVIHCALTPLAIGYLSATGLSFMGEEFIHKFLAIFLMLIAVAAFIPGFRNHRRVSVVAVGAIGASFLVIPNFALESLISHDLVLGLNIAGSFLLIGAHTANWRITDSHADCTDCTTH